MPTIFCCAKWNKKKLRRPIRDLPIWICCARVPNQPWIRCYRVQAFRCPAWGRQCSSSTKTRTSSAITRIMRARTWCHTRPRVSRRPAWAAPATAPAVSAAAASAQTSIQNKSRWRRSRLPRRRWRRACRRCWARRAEAPATSPATHRRTVWCNRRHR